MATIASPRSSSPAILPITSPSLSSTTPVSSVRTSIDLPSNAQPTAHLPPSNQRRNRAALRDYYNLKAKSAANVPGAATSPAPSGHNLSRTGSIASTTSDTTQLSSATLTTENGGHASTLPNTLDDPTFDAESYIASLLKTSSLRDIIKTESSLVSEIRNLDGERKALVYDNYSKLIVAVGTIGEMQKGIVQERGQDGEASGLARMKGLESKLDELMKGFGELVGTKTDGGNAAAVSKAKEEKKRLKEEKRKKDLVKWVLAAPDRLNVLVENGQREEAKKEWSEVEQILAKWEGVQGVAEARDACTKILEEESDEGE